MARLTQKQKAHYFDTVVNTVRVICNTTSNPMMEDKATLQFIHRTSKDLLDVLDKVGITNDTQGNAGHSVE